MGALAAVLAIGTAAYAMRAGGYLAAGALPRGGRTDRLLRLAPGNLSVAFLTAGVLQGGLPGLIGCAAAVVAMAATGKEWASLASGFAVAALVSALA